MRAVCDVIKQRFPEAAGTVAIGFVDAETSARLNRRYSGQHEPTDVLSFDYREGQGVSSGNELGDVAINVDQVRQQAARYCVPPEQEAALLATHGVLHLLGYDHQTDRQRRTLDTLQRDILKSAGLTYRDFWNT